jgi:hypothetical protein
MASLAQPRGDTPLQAFSLGQPSQNFAFLRLHNRVKLASNQENFTVKLLTIANYRRCSECAAVLHKNTILTLFRLVHFAHDKFLPKSKIKNDLLTPWALARGTLASNLST